MKPWKPLRDFKEADFSYNQEKKISESKKNLDLNQEKSKKLKKWMPPKIENIKKNPKKPTSKIQEVQTNANFLSKSFPSDISKEYLEETMRTFFYQSIDILRNWYWKRDQFYEKKIYIIFRSISKEFLKSLLLNMSTGERKEFIRIYQNEYSVTKTDILLSRKEFLDLLSQL
ncbi:MAG: hypothetical protein ACK4UJ_01820 [Leptonema sp. (in: bacteria)]